MTKKITIYTTNTCAFCEAVKKFLDSKNQTYTVVNIDESPEKRQELQNFTDRTAVPVTVVEDENATPKVVVGWNPAEITEAIA